MKLYFYFLNKYNTKQVIVEEREATEEKLGYQLESAIDNHGRPFSYIRKDGIGRTIDDVYNPYFVALTEPDAEKAADLFLDFYKNKIDNEYLMIKTFESYIDVVKQWKSENQ